MDTLRLKEMKFYAYHGDYPEEKKLGSNFTVDLELKGDFSTEKTGDMLEGTVDLREVYRIVKSVVSERNYNLTETLAEKIASAVLENFNAVEATVLVRKESPPIPGVTGAIEAVVTRSK